AIVICAVGFAFMLFADSFAGRDRAVEPPAAIPLYAAKPAAPKVVAPEAPPAAAEEALIVDANQPSVASEPALVIPAAPEPEAAASTEAATTSERARPRRRARSVRSRTPRGVWRPAGTIPANPF